MRNVSGIEVDRWRGRGLRLRLTLEEDEKDIGCQCGIGAVRIESGFEGEIGDRLALNG